MTTSLMVRIVVLGVACVHRVGEEADESTVVVLIQRRLRSAVLHISERLRDPEIVVRGRAYRFILSTRQLLHCQRINSGWKGRALSRMYV